MVRRAVGQVGVDAALDLPGIGHPPNVPTAARDAPIRPKAPPGRPGCRPRPSAPRDDHDRRSGAVPLHAQRRRLRAGRPGRSTRIRAVVTDRPIAREWACSQSGDCCRSTPAVVMTTEERALILAHPLSRDRRLAWDKRPSSNQWALRAAPCPFLDGRHCSIYPIRPYNCRRFGCFRPEPAREPFEPLRTRRSASGVRSASGRYQLWP